MSPLIPSPLIPHPKPDKPEPKKLTNITKRMTTFLGKTQRKTIFFGKANGNKP